MKCTAVLTLAASFGLANSAAVRNDFMDVEVLDAMLSNPFLLPRACRYFSWKEHGFELKWDFAAKQLLSHQVNSIRKRSPQLDGAAPLIAGVLAGLTPTPKNAPKSLVAEMQPEKAKYWPEAKRVKVRYGPFRIPPTSEKNFQSEMMNVQGMSTSFTPSAKKPCEDCTLLTLEADLEYADGKPAANSNGVGRREIWQPVS
jgi:hypothetical protein